MAQVNSKNPLDLFKKWFLLAGHHIFEPQKAGQEWLNEGIKTPSPAPPGTTLDKVNSFMGWSNEGVYFKAVPSGIWVEVTPRFPKANKGTVQAMIYPPGDKGGYTSICYGVCTGDAAHLQGKVSTKGSVEAAKSFLNSQFRHW